MRGHLAELDVNTGEAINTVVNVLKEPPNTEKERAKVIGDLYGILSKIELSLREARKISGPLLSECIGRAESYEHTIRGILVEAIYESQVAEFVGIIGTLLAPLKELHLVVKEAEEIRYENSKMRRE